MAINLFVDTNIWLSFYNPNPEIKILEKLLEKIKSGEINLLIPSHQIDEILRNKEELIFKQNQKSEKFLGKLNSIGDFPELLKEDFDSFIGVIKRKIQDHKDLAYEEKLEIDNSLNKIIYESEILDENNGIITLANERTLIKGNPPRKEKNVFKSCADAMIWETILYHSKNKEKIIIISNDGDYNSQIDDTKIKLFLKKEWEKKKDSEIKLYKSIGSFFQKEFIDTEIKEEEIKSEEESSKSVSSDLTTTALIPITFGSGSSYIPQTGSAAIAPFWSDPYNLGVVSTVSEKEIRCPLCGKVFYVKENSNYLFGYHQPSGVKCDHCNQLITI